jgi:hypothetical protein
MQQIRINMSSKIQEILLALKEKYPACTNSEIIKIALGNEFNRFQSQTLRESLSQSEQEYLNNQVSPTFTNPDDAVAWLNNED